MKELDDNSKRYVDNIKSAKLTIYDRINIGDVNLWIPSKILEEILNAKLAGLDLSGLPLRTRSKVVKEHICVALGYPVPQSFKKTKPRFLGQWFDTYTQKSNNLQVWNEELDPTRRYAIIKVSDENVIERVKVVNGDILASFDTTGKLTQKYQAKLDVGSEATELIATNDTDNLRHLIGSSVNLKGIEPASLPEAGSVMSICDIYERLSSLVGQTFLNTFNLFIRKPFL